MDDWVQRLEHRFDGYYDMTQADQRWLDEEIEHLSMLARRTIADVLLIGRRLLAIQDRLANYHDGIFTNWIKAECVWSKSAVYRFINVYTRFASFPNLGKLTIDSSALYLLASESTSESARLEAIERAEDGEMITHAKAKAIVKAHRRARPGIGPKFAVATAPYVALNPVLHGAPEIQTQERPSTSPSMPSIDRQIDTMVNLAIAIKHASEQSGLTPNQKQKITRVIEVLLSIE